jgi:hypothetical protein
MQVAALVRALEALDPVAARQLSALAGVGAEASAEAHDSAPSEAQRAAFERAVTAAADALDVGPTRVRAAIALALTAMRDAKMTMDQALACAPVP